MVHIRIKKILDEIQEIYDIHITCRAYFPTADNSVIGELKTLSPPFYQKYGYRIEFSYRKPLTAENIQRMNDIANWLNQNFIIRLYACLNSNCIVKGEASIDNNIEGSVEVRIVTRLRNKFAHGSGIYKPENNEHKKLFDYIVNHFNLNASNFDTYPLSINKVLPGLMKGCKKICYW